MDTIIEGTMMSVCKKCASFGVIVQPLQAQKPAAKTSIILPKEQEMDIVTPEFPSIVRKAREKKELTHQQLAQAIAEKETVIQKVEAGKLEPTLQLAKKLEQFLKVRLIIQEKVIAEKKVDLKDANLTIGDLLSIKQKIAQQKQ